MLNIITNPSQKHRRFGKILLLISLLLVSYLVFSKPTFSVPIAHGDKIIHFCTFFGLAALLQLATNWPIKRQVALLFCYAGLIEIVQRVLPYRTAEYADLAADALGCAFYFLLLVSIRYRQKQT